jgi:hypothetical protein
MFEKLSAARMDDIKFSPEEQSSGPAWQFEIEVTLKRAFAVFPSCLQVFEMFFCNFHTAVRERVAGCCCYFAGQIPTIAPSVAFV